MGSYPILARVVSPNPKTDPKRGRHRKAVSAETRKWEAEHLIPERPAWMDERTYVALAKMRAR
jgi:hypothetical protein